MHIRPLLVLFPLAVMLVGGGGGKPWPEPARAQFSAEKWGPTVRQKRLDATRRLALEDDALRLYDGETLKWRIEWVTLNDDTFELFPNGKRIAAWHAGDLTVLRVADGTTASTSAFLLLTTTEVIGDSCSSQPSRVRITGKKWIAQGLEVTIQTAVLWDGQPRSVVVRVDGEGKVTRATPTDDLEPEPLRQLFRAATEAEPRRQLFKHLQWRACQAQDKPSPEMIEFFVEVARAGAEELFAPAVMSLVALQPDGSHRAAEFVGRDSDLDGRLLFRSDGWTPDEKLAALTQVLDSKVDTAELQLRWFRDIAAAWNDFTPVAMRVALNPHPSVRAELIERLGRLPSQPAQFSASLKLLERADDAQRARARQAVLQQLKGAALKLHSAEILAAFANKTIGVWPEGSLRLGEYLQASGKLELAGGVFASAIETDLTASPIRNELLNRLALNLIIRKKYDDAREVIDTLQKSGGPVVCGLSLGDVREGFVPQCPGKLSPASQAPALLRMIEQP